MKSRVAVKEANPDREETVDKAVSPDKEETADKGVSLDREETAVSPDREETVEMAVSPDREETAVSPAKEVSLDREEMAVSPDREAAVDKAVSPDKEDSPDREEMADKVVSPDREVTVDKAVSPDREETVDKAVSLDKVEMAEKEVSLDRVGNSKEITATPTRANVNQRAFSPILMTARSFSVVCLMEKKAATLSTTLNAERAPFLIRNTMSATMLVPFRETAANLPKVHLKHKKEARTVNHGYIIYFICAKFNILNAFCYRSRWIWGPRWPRR
jgi:hypothetical protein